MQPQVYSATLTARLRSKFFQCVNCLLFACWRAPCNIARNRARFYFPASFCQRGSMPWTVDEIKSLISEIEDKPVLWNVFSDEYKDRVKKSEAWREVAAKLPRDQTEVSVSPTVQCYLFFDHCFCCVSLVDEINYHYNSIIYDATNQIVECDTDKPTDITTSEWLVLRLFGRVGLVD